MRVCLILSLLTFFFQSCKKDDPAGSGKAQLRVYLTDDPADYEEVNIDVQSVEIHSNTQGWQTLSTIVGIYNLLDLTNGIDTLIALDSLSSGTISQVRLNLGSNNTIKINGVIHPLDIPSGSTSGLKINVHQPINPGGNYVLLLDFDAGHSIVEQGNNQFKLKPVLRGEFINAPVLNAGIVKGVIMPPGSSAFVSAAGSADSASTYINTNSGEYLLQYLDPGTYNIWINVNPPYSDTTFTFTVTAGLNVIDTIWVD